MIFDNQKTKENGYLGNPNVKKDGVNIGFTKEQVVEYAKCMNDAAYFINTYVKIIHLDKGLTEFKLRGYQDKYIKHITDNKYTVVLAPRQSGKSVTSVAWLSWYIMFNSDKKVGILANKGAISREMLSRLTLMLENLPFWLQPGCRVLNKGSIKFSHNSEIIAAATSSSSIRGLSLNVLMLDEFAFVNKAAEFYTATYPVITSGDDVKVIITSTPNGVGNMFYKLWEGAVQKANEFSSFRIYWQDVPGRDEEWKRKTISNTSELQFKQEFGCIGGDSIVTIRDTKTGIISDKKITEIYNSL